MAKKEVVTDLWVHSLLNEADIEHTAQGSSIVEIDKALKTASKSGSGNVGFPEYVAVVKDFLLVVEDKPSISNHIKLDTNGLISMDVKSIKDYAVNGALFYGKHLVKNTSFKKAIVFGVSGDEKKHRITPVFTDETEYHRELPEVESFISFNKQNIDEYYTREVLNEFTDEEKTTAEILKDASTLHEDLRSFGSLKDIDKPLIVSGILLALRESEFKNFSVDDLTGDQIKTDGQKIYDAICFNLQRSNVSPEVKKDKILNQFSVIKDTKIINEINESLGKTPLKHFSEFLYEKLYKSIKYTNTSEDYLGRFYGEFMSYSGGDGQTLGIVLTPKHITDLFCDLVDIQLTDVVLDPCCGTAGFLVAAMHHMLSQTTDENIKRNIKQHQLHGIESQSYMFTIATTNMILRGDGKSNLINEDFLKQNPHQIQLKQATVAMMNPPYSQGTKQNSTLYEIAFTERLLDSVTVGGRVAVIIPQSSVTGKTTEEKTIKQNILKKHTLEGVITLNKDTFYGVGTMPCIALFTSGYPHPYNKECKFIDFREDGFKVSAHIGLVETEQAKDKKQHLLDVWFERIDAETKFCVKTAVEAGDEWLHSFYYFNDEIPKDAEFEKTIGDYLSFEFSMTMHNRSYLFEYWTNSKCKDIECLDDKEWAAFKIGELFDVDKGVYLNKKNIIAGKSPYITASSVNNGVSDFIGNQTLFPKNTITIEKVRLSSFYQPHPYYCSHDVSTIAHQKLNKFISLFVATMINRQGSKYSYGRQAQLNVVKRETVFLPVIAELDDSGMPVYETDEDGNVIIDNDAQPIAKMVPDWDYMEQFIINLEYKKRKQYLNCITLK